MDPAALWIRIQEANKLRTLRIRIRNKVKSQIAEPHQKWLTPEL
jgi:hypothetical protein